jgi:hypothetical protein
MIGLYELKYSLGALFLVAMVVFLGFLPWVKAWGDGHPSSEASLLEATTTAVILSIVYLALAGIVLALLPMEVRRICAGAAVLFPIASGVLKILLPWHPVVRKFFPARDLVFVGGVLAFSVMILLIASLKLPLPDNLPDGAYVNKEHVSAVRIQSLTGDLPADNVIPYVVQEYLARSISFARNGPILPGQHVTNRPILVSLVALPFRLFLRPLNSMTDLPTYNYVGTQWPDFRVLVRDEAAFSVFLGIAVFLNACLLLGTGLVIAQIKQIEVRHCFLLLLLFVTSPYLIFQTVFTWPKALAGFFIIVAAFHYLKYRRTLLSGILIGLAYLSHPYALVYFGVAIGLITIDISSPLTTRLKRASLFSLAFIVVLIPWFAWAKLVIGIDSDLVQQNFSINGMSAYQFALTRIVNLMNTVLPVHLQAFGISFNSVFAKSSLNFGGAVGIIFFVCIVLTHEIRRMPVRCSVSQLNPLDANSENLKMCVYFCALSSLLLTFVFSNPAVPLLHGWQPLVALTLALGVYWASRAGKIGETLCWAQIAVNALGLPLYLAGRLTKLGIT